MCIMISITGFGQTVDSSAVFNEIWSFKSSSFYKEKGMIILKDPIKIKPTNRGAPGLACFFYKNGNYKMDSWWYGLSMGYQHMIINGTYQYNPTTNEIQLSFDIAEHDTMYFKDIPMVHYFLQTLLVGERISISDYHRGEKGSEYSKPILYIINQNANEITFDLLAYDNNGQKVSFGQTTFIREKIKELK